MQEWVIFVLCLGIGGHTVLGVVMHDPSLWPWSTTGFYGLLSGLAVYGLVQTGRGVWKLLRHTQVLVEEWTQRLIVNRRADGGRTLGIDPSASNCVELFYVRPSA